MAYKAKEKGNNILTKKFLDKTIATLDIVNTSFSASDDVPSALYLTAQSQYLLGDYENSTSTFLKVAESYPKFQMASNALFKAAEIQQMLKESGLISKSQADSKIWIAYQQLVQKYPDSPLAGAAQSWLDKNGSR
jgi:TolA-binding protein